MTIVSLSHGGLFRRVVPHVNLVSHQRANAHVPEAIVELGASRHVEFQNPRVSAGFGPEVEIGESECNGLVVTGFRVLLLGGSGLRSDDVRKAEAAVFVLFCHHTEVGAETNVLTNFDDVLPCRRLLFPIVDEGEVGTALLDGFVRDDTFLVVRDETESHGDGGEFCSSSGIQ